MTHELIEILQTAALYESRNQQTVVATVVDLDGSSYRGPGVRMLLTQEGEMVGAVSGGCVEKEVFLRAESVFKTGVSKVITYDGRYRLGCEGLLYILIEPIQISLKDFNEIKRSIENRTTVNIRSYFKLEEDAQGNFGSIITFEDRQNFSFSRAFSPAKQEELHCFDQLLKPLFRLTIVGGEHDAAKLCSMASLLGWEVEVVTSINNSKSLQDFPGASKLLCETPDSISFDYLDWESAVVLMTHNYAQDLKFLLKLRNAKYAYIGILGSAKRRDKLQHELFEFMEDLSEDFLDDIHSPAGLNLGAETPEEIALSILAEILAVTRNKEPFSLKTVRGKIHLNFE